MKNPYSNIPPTIWLIAMVTLISRSGSMVLMFLPLYLTQKLNFSITIAGQILAFYGIGEVTGSYIGGILSDRFGFLSIQTTGLLIIGISYIALEFFHIQIEIMAIIFLIGFLTAGLRPATSTNIARHSSPDNRARSYALNYQAINLGCSIGPALGGMLASLNYAWLFRIDGIANILAAVALILFFHKRKETAFITDTVSHSIGLSPWRNLPFLLLLLLIFLVGTCFFLSLNTYPLFLKDVYHISESKIGIILGLNGLLIILLQMQLTSCMKIFNSVLVIGIGGIIIALGYFILPFYSGFNFAILSIILISLGEMIAVPFMFDYVTKIAPTKARGRYLSLVSLALMSAPLVVAPSLSMYVYTKFGANILWYGVGICGVIILIGSVIFSKKCVLPFPQEVSR